ncbi:MAG TPA: Bax inhibitor-1/YccA family protein [Gammaproteobacteria bacterium]|nr:Bax inhibitor-1/YccA family protein [Gammaproteobacteria bacterium]HQZ88255.1 Bax inhibitor-1/YccA family protein [Gammaproteobacteria bacterium]HRA43270.1 Bax inhibitor-1/YccA family protein [Gammaproteobacteria bacterium]
MQPNIDTVRHAQSGMVIQTNSVIRNTYILLSMTLLFSAFTAWLAMLTNATPMGLMVLPIYFGLLFLTQSLRNSVWGIASIFAFTGFMGYTLGPILNFAIQGFSNGTQIIMASLGLTGLIFFALSGYALTTRKDFSYLGGFLFVAATIGMMASIVGLFFPVPLLYLGVSSAFVLIASGTILFQTSQIIHDGERNYIMATIALYVSIYNLFISLLQLFMLLAGRRNN